MKRLFTTILSTILFFGFSVANAQNMEGMIKYPTYGGPDANAYYIPASAPTNRVLIVFHSWYGLTDNIKKDAQTWQKTLDGNASIYVVDLFDGKTVPDNFSAQKLAANLDPSRAEAIVKGILDKIGIGKQITTLGYGIGGPWAFKASVMAGANAVGCVMFYSAPIKDESLIAAIKTDVQFIWANGDEYNKKDDMLDFGKKLTAAGHAFSFQQFNGGNGFANIGDAAFFENTANETTYWAGKYMKHKMAL